MESCQHRDTRVSNLDVAAYHIPTDAQEADGTLSWSSTTMALVAARAGCHTGFGWSYGPAAIADVVRNKLADLVIGADALNVAGVFTTMVHAVRNIGRSGIGGQAISAVDTALWDLKARLLNVPLYRLLGAVREDVAIYGSGGFTSYDESQLNSQLSYWTAELAIPRVKIKIGESWGQRVDRDVARMRQARGVIGDDVELFVDANGAYGRKQAVRVWQQAADLDVRWYEEPVSADDLHGLCAVRAAVTADVAAGEYGYSLYDFQRLCAGQAVDCLQVDASRCGGVTEWLRAGAVAAAHGLDVSAHCAPYLHVHAAAALPNFRHLEWFHDHVRIERMFFDGAAPPIGGRIWLDPTAAGNGLALKAADIEQFRIR